QTSRVMPFAYHELHSFAAHALLQLDDMTRRRVHTSTELDRPDRLHTEALGKVDQIRMVANELHTAQRCGLALPTGDRVIKLREVGRQICLEGRCVFRVVARQAVCNRPSYGLPLHWIEVDVWVPQRVLVTERPVDAGRHFQRSDIHRTVDVARS